MLRIKQFLSDLDREWTPTGKQRIRLTIIGSAALILQAPHERGTKDSDILETNAITTAVAKNLRALAGKETKLAKRHGIYLDVVRSGLPFLPQKPNCHQMSELNADLSNFEVEVLDIVDVVVSKLKRFSANDRADIGSMIDLGLVPHGQLIERFRNASDYFSHDARTPDLPAYIENLHQVEQDMMGVSRTDIELPPWI